MKQEAPVIYVWFAENKGAERDGEQFIRAWTHDPARVDGLRNAIGKEPTIYSAILQAATDKMTSPTPSPISQAAGFDMLAHLARQRAWSEMTFGPGARTKGVVDHIRKELLEIEADPTDLTEWIDVVILALDGAWRAGGSPEQIIATMVAKQTKNEGRAWPDWRTADPDKAIEHDRSGDTTPTTGSAPVATLHDDGYYTFHGEKPHGFNYQGWRMDVYVATASPAASVLTFLEVGTTERGAAINAAMQFADQTGFTRGKFQWCSAYADALVRTLAASMGGDRA